MIPGISAPLLTADAQQERGRLKEAAGQFESMLIAQMLQSARQSSGGGWTGDSEDQASVSLMEMSEQSLAQVLSANGGFGLSKLIVEGLSRKSEIPATQKALIGI